jgi:hypothetical protein
VGILGSKAAKESLDKEIQHYEKYPPHGLIKWMKNKHEEDQQEKWDQPPK